MSKRKPIKSRRRFVKNVGGLALGAATASTVSTLGCAPRTSGFEWDATYDWVCVGSSIEGGLEAAVFGHDQGLNTLLVEESGFIGGRQGSHGLFFVPANHLMQEAGIPDSREEALSWLRYVGGGYSSPEHMAAFVDNAPRAIEHLQTQADVQMWMCPAPDFWGPYSEGSWRLDETLVVGSKPRGRSLTVEPFPVETLGNWRNRILLSDYYHHFEEVLEGQEHNPSLGMVTSGKRTMGPHVGHWGPLRGEETVALRLWRERLGQEKFDELVRKDEEEYVAGAALAAYLLRALDQRGVEVRTETRPERLLTEDGRVVGVVVNYQGQEENIRANKGVILGTGLSDAWRLAAHVGGEVYSKIRLPSLGSFEVQEAPGRMGRRGSNYEIRARHSMFVNRFGERFGNEEPYQGIATLVHFDSHGAHRFINIPSYYIFDQNLIDKYSFAGRPPGATEGLEWLARGNTIGELAQQLNLPAANLEATVARFNQYAEKGEDPDFHRRPETLGPVAKPPFYGTVAHREAPATDPLRAQTCVVTDTNGQVMHHETQTPIPGLYCTSQLQEHQFVLGVGYQAGLHMAMGSAFSLLAAEHAAESG